MTKPPKIVCQEPEVTPECRCQPTLDYKCPENANEVWVHNDIQHTNLMDLDVSIARNILANTDEGSYTCTVSLKDSRNHAYIAFGDDIPALCGKSINDFMQSNVQLFQRLDSD